MKVKDILNPLFAKQTIEQQQHKMMKIHIDTLNKDINATNNIHLLQITYNQKRSEENYE